jgi:cytochrome P450
MAPSLSGIDGIRLLWHVARPLQFGGFVAPSRRFWPGLVRRRVPVATNKFLHHVRKKYGPRVRCWFPFNSTILVLDAKGIDEVLRSECNAADPRVKRWALTNFTPFGLLVSRDDDWKVRRHLNEEALATHSAPHPDSFSFLSIVETEVERLRSGGRTVLDWDEFSALGARISQQVIFGEGKFRPEFDHHLSRLVAWSNWFLRHPCHFVRFKKHIEDGLKSEAHASLACAVGRTASSAGAAHATTQPVSQAAFWCFVLKDAIELHAARTLALIASASLDFRTRLMQEVSKAPSDPARFSTSTPLLEGSIREQLRLWTPVPILPRSALRDFTFDGTPVRERQQILLHPGFYHRDPEVFGSAANRFCPEGPSSAHEPLPLYSFSGHRQGCAGEPLVMLVLKAVLTALLQRGTLELLEGRIDTHDVPVAIDHFALRFAWRPHGALGVAEG